MINTVNYEEGFNRRQMFITISSEEEYKYTSTHGLQFSRAASQISVACVTFTWGVS